MKKILWKLLEWCDNNWGYTTPLQKRFNIGDKCKISTHKIQSTPLEVGNDVVIVETGRHDYLVRRVSDNTKVVVYQYELI